MTSEEKGEEKEYSRERLVEEGFRQDMRASVTLKEPMEFRITGNDKKPSILASLVVEISSMREDYINVFPYIPQGWRKKRLERGFGANIPYTNIKNIERASAPIQQ